MRGIRTPAALWILLLLPLVVESFQRPASGRETPVEVYAVTTV